MMLLIFYWWRGIRDISIFYWWHGIHDICRIPVNPLAALTVIAWVMTGVFLVMDLVRHRSQYYDEQFFKHWFFKRILRSHEHQSYTASTYYLFGASVLMTGVWLGLLKEVTMVMAIMVLGLADPVTGWARYRWSRRGIADPRFRGFLVFALVSFLVMLVIASLLDSRLGVIGIGIISVAVALMETFTRDIVEWCHPFMAWFRSWFPELISSAMKRFWLDDNLGIQVAVGLLAFVLDR